MARTVPRASIRIGVVLRLDGGSDPSQVTTLDFGSKPNGLCSSQLRRDAAQSLRRDAAQHCATQSWQRLRSAGTCVSKTIVVEKKHATHQKPTRKVHLTKPESGFNRGCKLTQQITVTSQLFCWCLPQLIRGDSQCSHHVTQQPSITLQVG